jgi:hypothetical protein
MSTTKAITITITTGIIRGDSTQNHDHWITPASFNPMNSTVSNPKNPIPADEDDELSDILFLTSILTP